MSFQNKVVCITGGGTGIGAATARSFAAAGAKVVLNGRREDVLAQTARRIGPSGENVVWSSGDIAKPETSRKMIAVAVERFGRIDVLVNNAGIFKPTAFLDSTEVELDAYLDIVLKGTFFASQEAVKHMQKRGKGAIVNVGSMWGNQAIGATPSAAYSAAKAGVHALTRNLAIEFGSSGIRVNAVAPAVVETPVYNTFMTDEEVAKVLPTFNAFHPLGRNGQAEDVAAAILFLAGDESSWITGAVLPVDGGVAAGRN